MNNYLLETSDFTALKTEIDKIIKKEKFNDALTSTYDAKELQLENALEDLDTYGFLSDKKVIIINNIDGINQEDEEKNLKHLYKYLENPNPDNLLIITASKLNNTLKVTKEFYIMYMLSRGFISWKQLESLGESPRGFFIL